MSSPQRIKFEPALEGLRGFALLGMLLFHSQFEWARGGFLPIATFFTLSGYLITSLFLAEWERSGRLDLVAFWARRFRRLMPAALLTLMIMAFFARFLASAAQRTALGEDVFWSLFYVANWHFYISNTAYTELFSAPSPVQHFWSLAIEEQFYFLFPLLAAGGLILGRGSRFSLGAVLLVLSAVSVLIGVVLIGQGAPIDRVYYGSDTRAAELLLGGALAVWMFGRPAFTGGFRSIVQVVGMLCLFLMVWSWSVVDLESVWLYQGGFALYTLLSLGVILAAVQPDGPLRKFLGNRVLRWTGRVSYAAYLFHWPIFLLLNEQRTGLGEPALLLLRTSITFGLAECSYRFLESPIRSGQWLRGARPYFATAIAVLVVVSLSRSAIAVPRFADGGYDPSPHVAEIAPMFERLKALPPVPSGSASEVPLVPRVGVYGDSTGAALTIGLSHWLERTGEGQPRIGVAELGCGLLREGDYRYQGKVLPRPAHCQPRRAAWEANILSQSPHVAVVSFGPWEVCDRRLAGDGPWMHLGDPMVDQAMQAELLEAVDLLSARGALVVWLTHPVIEVRDPETGAAPVPAYPESSPARMARFNELVRELEALRPGKVVVLDVAGYLRNSSGGELDPLYRPDGTHLDAEGSLRLANDFIGPEVLRLYREQRTSGSADLTPSD